jgi:hypothetical protein
MLRRKPTSQRGEFDREQPFDEELIALQAVTDPAAFAPLYRHYLPEILAFCVRRTACQSDA